jgi:hypothetical protein
VADGSTTGWVVIGGVGSSITLQRLNADGSPSDDPLSLDPGQPTFVGRVTADTSNETIIAVWTRTVESGYQVIAARLTGRGDALLVGPVVLQTAPAGTGLGVEEVAVNPITGQPAVLTQSGVLIGDAISSTRRSTLLVNGDLMVTDSASTTPGNGEPVAFSQSTAAYTAAGPC